MVLELLEGGDSPSGDHRDSPTVLQSVEHDRHEATPVVAEAQLHEVRSKRRGAAAERQGDSAPPGTACPLTRHSFNPAQKGLLSGDERGSVGEDGNSVMRTGGDSPSTTRQPPPAPPASLSQAPAPVKAARRLVSIPAFEMDDEYGELSNQVALELSASHGSATRAEVLQGVRPSFSRRVFTALGSLGFEYKDASSAGSHNTTNSRRWP